jgi:hypothetical protein
MTIPDIIGYTIEEARNKLQQCGIHIESISITAPPKEKLTEFDIRFRVIKVSVIDENKIDLLICKPL